VNTAMNVAVVENAGNFLNSWGTTSFIRRALLHGVGWLEVTLTAISSRHWFLFSPDKISLYPTIVRCNVKEPPSPSYTYLFSYFYYSCVIHVLIVVRIFVDSTEYWGNEAAFPRTALTFASVGPTSH
jgi:hypothetical protein